MFLVRKLKRFGPCERGSVTIEALMWFIMMVGIIGITIDVAAVFHTQSDVLRTLQDGNRRMSANSLKTTDAVEDYIEAELAYLSSNVVATSTEDTVNNIISTTVSVPARDLQWLGFFSSFNNVTIRVSGQHYIEEG